MKPRFSFQSSSPKQNHYTFHVGDARYLIISSNFEAGNIRLACQNSFSSYVLESVSDMEGITGKKSWFYFKMKCVPGFKVKISISNLSIYQNCLNSKYEYQPVFRLGCTGIWKSLANSILYESDNISLAFDYKFTSAEEVFFCLSVPFTYTDNQIYLSQLETKLMPSISYKNQLLAITPQNREIRLLSISQYGQERDVQQKNKPVVLITSRVHPGEVTSSYCLMGIIEMLIRDNLLGYLLRRLFQWKIIPMVNPDGVAAGNYRMDPQGCNLNRQYLDPDQVLHPAAFEIIQLMKQLSVHPKKIEFYFDLHSHSSIKDSFIYGNAFDDVVLQSYTQLYCKILEENHSRFKSSLCEFGQKHMKYKDRGEEKTKEGCGRVMALKIGGVTRSYTLQSTILPGCYQKSQKNSLKECRNTDFTCLPKGYSQSLGFLIHSQGQISEHPLIITNKQLGKDVLISILDMVQKNPFSRLSVEYHSVCVKQLIQKNNQKEERFKVYDLQSYSRCKTAVKIIEEEVQKKMEEAWIRAGIGAELVDISWPQEFKMFKLLKQPNNSKIRIKLKGLRMISENHDSNAIQEKKRIKTSFRSDHLQLSSLKDIHLDKSSDKMIVKSEMRENSKQNQVLYSLQFQDQAQVRQLNIFQEVPTIVLDKVTSIQKRRFKNSYKAEASMLAIHTMTPSLCLLNSAKFISQASNERKKLKLGIRCRPSLQNRQRAVTELKNRLSLNNNSSLPHIQFIFRARQKKSIDKQCKKDATNGVFEKSQKQASKLKKGSVVKSMGLPQLRSSNVIPLKDYFIF